MGQVAFSYLPFLRNLCNLRMNSHLPIGIFDSGVGGLTVYRALHEQLPNERFVYLGDTARVPYGTKSLSTVERYAVENAEFLAGHGVKMLVVACNTASALALPAIREALDIDVAGVIGPGARAAAAAMTKRAGGLRTVGVIATESTVRSGAYTAAIKKADPTAEVIEQACPLLVPLAEEGWVNNEVAHTVAETYLKDLQAKIDTLVLGCTHYPLLTDAIARFLAGNVELVDSARNCAKAVEQLLDQQSLRASREGEGSLQVALTDAPDTFLGVARRALQLEIGEVQLREVLHATKL